MSTTITLSNAPKGAAKEVKVYRSETGDDVAVIVDLWDQPGNHRFAAGLVRDEAINVARAILREVGVDVDLWRQAVEEAVSSLEGMVEAGLAEPEDEDRLARYDALAGSLR